MLETEEEATLICIISKEIIVSKDYFKGFSLKERELLSTYKHFFQKLQLCDREYYFM